MTDPVSKDVVDARGKACPVPIVELARALRIVPENGELELWATDPAVRADLEAFCVATGHVLVSFSTEDRILRARIRKAAIHR